MDNHAEKGHQIELEVGPQNAVFFTLEYKFHSPSDSTIILGSNQTNFSKHHHAKQKLMNENQILH